MLTPTVTYLGPAHPPSTGTTGTTPDRDGPGQPARVAIASSAPPAGTRLRARYKRAASACRALVATCLVLAACLAGTAQASAPSSLSAGQQLRAGQYLLSPNGQYDLVMQSDGNLVEYNSAGQPLWATNRLGTGNWAVMQNDGNLVVYTASGQPVWNSGTYGFQGSGLQLQNDGNVVIYQGSHPVWASKYGYIGNLVSGGITLTAGDEVISASHQYQLIMQGDGNLVEYQGSCCSTAVWDSHTNMYPGSYAVMQPDGNLVVVTAQGQPVWSSGTFNHSGAHLELEGEASLFVRASNGLLLWGANRAWGQTLTYNPGGYGQCTYWAEQEFQTNTGYFADTLGIPGTSGDAMYWGSNAKARGWTVTTTPHVDSIVVFQPGVDGASSVGHVAWVTAVNGSQITVSEMNVRGWNVVDTTSYPVQQGAASDGQPAMQFILAP